MTEYLFKEGDELSSGELVQLPRVLHLVQLPVQVLHLSNEKNIKEAKYESAECRHSTSFCSSRNFLGLLSCFSCLYSSLRRWFSV